MIVEDLLIQRESEWLDFKAEFHKSNEKLLHDILCLCNSNSESDRYLVFGVKDDRSICGVENDINTKSNANIQDFLKNVHLNRLPVTSLTFFTVENHKVAVLQIENQTNKPFFLTQDFGNGKELIRAGVVYTRLGDTNTSQNKTASEDQIETMWRERFGIKLDPYSRFENLVEVKDDWIAMGEHRLLYHRSFPEFTIRECGIEVDGFVEDWTKRFPDRSASSYGVEVRYHTTALKWFLFVSCDGGR